MAGSFWYSIAEDGEGDDATRYECKRPYHLPRRAEAQCAAEHAAEDYHGNHDGWESTWPLTVVLYETQASEEVSRWQVELEHVPSFSAYEPSGRQ